MPGTSSRPEILEVDVGQVERQHGRRCEAGQDRQERPAAPRHAVAPALASFAAARPRSVSSTTASGP